MKPNLEELEALCEKAPESKGVNTRPSRLFYDAARTALPELIERVRFLEKAEKALREMAEEAEWKLDEVEGPCIIDLDGRPFYAERVPATYAWLQENAPSLAQASEPVRINAPGYQNVGIKDGHLVAMEPEATQDTKQEREES